MTDEPFPHSRAAALARLAAFAPRMGGAYAAGRNTDPGPGARHDVSRLSPAIRRRLVTEAEVVAAALAAHGADGARKFIEEVFWRSYWKGFLQLRPALWTDYQAALAVDERRLHGDAALAAAMEGRTGIACFDAWMAELVAQGWLHNHARMWFASIWIFTLGLPWTLGAALFERHLLDADAASNTLSWRWVAGLHTQGKHYLARAENIARYSDGRFDPAGQLNERAPPLPAEPLPPLRPLPPDDAWPAGPVALLLHEDDLAFESLLPPRAQVAAVAGLALAKDRGAPARGYVAQALADGLARATARFGVEAPLLSERDCAAWAAGQSLPVVAPFAPVGWTAAALDRLPVPVLRPRRDWDSRCWPLATKGFFPFRGAIPELLRAIPASDRR